jgi:hypothetical protein
MDSESRRSASDGVGPITGIIAGTKTKSTALLPYSTSPNPDLYLKTVSSRQPHLAAETSSTIRRIEKTATDNTDAKNSTTSRRCHQRAPRCLRSTNPRKGKAVELIELAMAGPLFHLPKSHSRYARSFLVSRTGRGTVSHVEDRKKRCASHCRLCRLTCTGTQ